MRKELMAHDQFNHFRVLRGNITKRPKNLATEEVIDAKEWAGE